MGEDYSVRFEVSFMPARTCAHCDELTTLGIAGTEPHYSDFVVLPLCTTHGYVAPHIGGQLAEYASIERFVCWIHGQKGQAQIVGPVEAGTIDEWRREQGSVKTEVKAWAARHTFKQHTEECFVVWNAGTKTLEYYEPNEKEEKTPVNEQQQNKMNLYSQYRQAYGDLATTGMYNVGDRVYFDGGSIGEVIWKYHSANGLMYVLDDNTGFPTEERSQDIEGRA